MPAKTLSREVVHMSRELEPIPVCAKQSPAEPAEVRDPDDETAPVGQVLTREPERSNGIGGCARACGRSV